LIIYRYISRQLFASTLGISFFLVLIFFSGRFIRYMGYAAEGRIAGDALFSIMAFRLPEFLVLILPLGMFLGILMAYGRLYLDSEMTVLQASGISQWQITKLTATPALCMTLVVAGLSFYLVPTGTDAFERIASEARSKSSIKLLTPGRFQTSTDKTKVTYTESLNSERTSMSNIFVASDDNGRLSAVFARSGERYLDHATRQEFLRLSDGHRYEGQPGQADYRVTAFKNYTVRMAKPEPLLESDEIKRLSTQTLMQMDTLAAHAELHWRIALPLLVPVVVLLAIPLSRVNPRQGRYMKMLPAILGYLAYLSLLLAGRGWIESGKIPAEFGLWWIHVAFFVVALMLHWWPSYRTRRKALHGLRAVQ